MWVRDGVVAGVVGGVVGAVPSTVHALVGRGRVLAATEAAGAVLVPGEERSGRLVLAALPVHFGVSVWWGVVFARVLPVRRTSLWGGLGGLVIAAGVLRVPGRRMRRVRELPRGPQVLDHLVYGVTVGTVLAELRRRALSVC